MMISDDNLSVLETLGYYVEIAAADVCEYDKIGINSADLFKSLLAEIFHDSQMNDGVETFYRFESYCAGG